MYTPKVFLSSTFVDLAAVRGEISRWLAGLFEAKLIVMETLGSDSAPPEINSVRRVRECDLFIGIYAHRYGTIDERSGKSITELELDEASTALSAGTMRDILLFTINVDSPWLSEHKETGAIAVAGLARLKTKVKSHTYTSFSGKEDLIFYVIRDVNKRLSQLVGRPSLQTRELILLPPKALCHPVGMEYLSVEYRDFLLGRATDVKAVLNLLQSNAVVLLLGESGIGKTSLVHAGLIPAVMTKGWRVVYTRPLGLPSTDITRQLLATIFEGQPFYRGPLMPLLGEISGALQGQHLLLIIDQFEDVLLSRDITEVDNLVSDIRIIRTISPPLVSILLSYRSDLEGRLGMYWQQISGSALGLPRFYLNGLTIKDAWKSLNLAAHSLKTTLELRAEERERIMKDLLYQSKALGYPDIYPPYVQMTLDHFWTSSHDHKYKFKSYQDVGGMEGIITGYLGRQLNYAQDTQGKMRAILISLVRSYGVKAQKELAEISTDTGLRESECDEGLEKLIDLRLVRHIPPYYEISHDFIARRISNELVDSEEREFKRFREVLTSKSAAFRTTRALLTAEEQLMLYKHRQRLLPTDEELRLILATWVHKGGPGLCWLLSADTSQILNWLRAEEADEDIEEEARAAAVLLRRKLGEMPLVEKDYQAFKRYQLSVELASLIRESAKTIPVKLLLVGLRHRREEVRAASIAAIATKLKADDYSCLGLLVKSTSVSLRQAFEELVLRPDIPIPKISLETAKAVKKFALLKRLVEASSTEDAKKLYLELANLRISGQTKLLALSLLAVKHGRLEQLISRARNSSRDKARVILQASRGTSSRKTFSELVRAYCEWNALETDRYDRSPLNTKASFLSATIRAMMVSEYLPILRKCFSRMRLTSSSREITLALLQYGNRADLRLVFERISNESERIDYWNHTELGKMAGRNMQLRAKGIPKYIQRLIRAKEFQEYVFPADRRQTRTRDLLPLASVSNRALYIRLTAYSAIGASINADAEYLLQLATHQYSLIARGAALKLVKLFGIDAFKMISERIDGALLKGESSSVSEALHYAEMQFYGVSITD
jgi:hypothetical protein